MSSLAAEAQGQQESERHIRRKSADGKRNLVGEGVRPGDSSQHERAPDDEIAPTDGAEEEEEEEEDGPPSGPPPETYFTRYRWMREHMPHWENTFLSSRGSESSTIQVYDADGQNLLQQWHHPCPNTGTFAGGEAMPATKDVPPLNLPLDSSHTILVQDISPTLINTLGQVLQISPDVFEEHLHHSGYRGTDSYQDADPRTWWTRDQGNQHKTLRWFSVVNRFKLEPLSTRDREQLLEGKLEWSEEEQKSPGVKIYHTLRTRTNVFRPEWLLRRAAGPDETIATMVWEEQVTCFRTATATPAEQTVFFIDPLPVVAHGRSRGGNFFSGGGAQIRWSRDVLFQRATRRIPPVVSLNDHSQGRDRFTRYASNTQSTLSEIRAWMRFLHGRSKSDRASEEKGKSKKEAGKAANQDNEGDTAEEAQNEGAGNPGQSPTRAIPTTALLQVIRIDTMCLLRHLSVILDSITTDAMSERLMQERLSSWRTLLNWAQRELPRLSDSLTEFFSFATAATPKTTNLFVPGLSPSHTPVPPDPQVVKLQKAIQEVVARCDRTQEHLRAEMSLLESKRGIAQAENVTRLTELAFIFIPMSFAAALFSMQLQELEETPPRAWMFVVSAFGFVVLAYALRLVLRSPTINWRIQGLGRRIRTERQVPDGVAVPAHKAVGWVWERVHGGRIVGFLIPWVGLYAALVAVLCVFVGNVSFRIGLVVLVTVLMGPVMFVVWCWVINEKTVLPDISRFYPQPRKQTRVGDDEGEEG